jgi:hypothetical protein
MAKRTPRRSLKLVLPDVTVWPAPDDWDFPVVQGVQEGNPETGYIKAVVGMTVAGDRPFRDVTIGEIHDFVDLTLRDPAHSYLVFVAAAHQVAAHALDDPFFKRDRFKTRIDEWLHGIWELAQDIYEHSRDLQVQAWPPTRAKSKSAVGLGIPRSFRPSSACSSGAVERPPEAEVKRQAKLFGEVEE